MMGTTTKATITTYRRTNALRWRSPNQNEHAPVLQQAWEVIETGKIEWRDVDYVDLNK